MTLAATAPALFTIDVEEWYQPAVMERYVPRNIWAKQPLRLQESLHLLTDALDAHGMHATLFCLSSLPREHDALIRNLAEKGHEIASHGHSHRSFSGLSKAEIKEELISSKKTLEDITGKAVTGFRAPNFSITDDTIELLIETGYQYDSSFFDVKWHPNYGKLQRHPKNNVPYRIHPELIEVPMTVLNWGPLRIPWSGGAYFRHFPSALFRSGVKHLIRDGYYHFYIHPWELDTKQPRPEQMNLINRMRHFRNISQSQDKLEQLLQSYQFRSIRECLGDPDYMHSVNPSFAGV
jgi:polysaccharide deacetylase family protein (PEP-CTERM system associated)